MKLIPYLTFDGDCEKALERYKELFEGEVVYIQYFKDGPDMGLEEEHLCKIMHAELKIGDISIYLSDNFPGSTLPKDSRIGLNLALDTPEKQQFIFNQLAVNGEITMPLEKQFWGDIFGSVKDEFGIPWSLNCAQ